MKIKCTSCTDGMESTRLNFVHLHQGGRRGVLHCSSAPGYIRTTSPSHLGSMGVALVMHQVALEHPTLHSQQHHLQNFCWSSAVVKRNYLPCIMWFNQGVQYPWALNKNSLAVPHTLQLQRMVIPAAPKVLLYIVPCQTPLIESTLGCGLFLPGIYIAACRQCVHVQPHFV